jgi:hypothetical protein
MKRSIWIVIALLCTVALTVRALGGTTTPSFHTAGQSPPTLQTNPQAERPYTVAADPTLPTRSLHTMRLGTPPTIDGDLHDWPLGEDIELDRTTAYSFFGGISSKSDLSAVIRSGWDERTLYFAVQVSDDVIVTDSVDVWRDDGVEIGLDGLYDRYAWGSDDHQCTVVADGRIADRTVATTDFAAAVTQTSNGYIVEMAVPMSKLLPGIPISGTVMGFTVGLHDDDDGGTWDAYLIWEGTNTSSKPQEFGSLIFTERIEDRISALEARIGLLERRTKELLGILAEFETVTPP